MIKVDIVNEVSKIADITKVKAEVAVDAVFDAMRTSMQRGERIELRGFGVFQVKPRKRGIGRNPAPARKCASRPAAPSASSPAKTSRTSDNRSLDPAPLDFSVPVPDAGSPSGACAEIPGPRRLPCRAAAADHRHDHAGRHAPLRCSSCSRFRHPRPLIFGAAAGGFWYSVTILAILGCHELGHYFACRYYDVDASLPFFCRCRRCFADRHARARSSASASRFRASGCCSTSASPARSPGSSSRCRRCSSAWRCRTSAPCRPEDGRLSARRAAALQVRVVAALGHASPTATR